MADGSVGGFRRGQGTELKYSFDCVVPGFTLVSFSASEGLFSDFSISVQLAHVSPDIDLHALMDTEAKVGMHHEYDPTIRWLHGVVTEISRGEEGFHRTTYTLTLRPAFARLRLGSDSRIWQDKSVPDIVAEVLGWYGVVDTEWNLAGSYSPREYCVQYRENHAEFIERLLAEEGIYYFYRHGENGHRMVFMDASQSAPVLEAAPEITYNARTSSMTRIFYISAFRLTERLRPTQVTLKDYTFLQPAYPNMQAKSAAETNGTKGAYDIYDYPGRYQDDRQSVGYTKVRGERARVDATTGSGRTNCLHLSPGFFFTLTDHDTSAANAAHFITQVNHSGTQSAGLKEDAGSAPTTYACSFATIPSRLPYRAPTQERPKVDGPQIAIVTGPPGEEIYCDEHGRIKVQFPWDRYAKGDETTTCWIRVAQNWGGAGWGHIAIPRIGHEVIVDFLEGDPDQPIVTGRTYHAANKPPYHLPQDKTVMAIKSRTHKGDGYNELRFEDEAGSQQIFMHAQKDQDIIVLNDRREHIFRDRHKSVEQDQYEITKRDHHTIIGKDRIEQVQNSSFLSIAKDLIVEIGQNVIRTVTGGEVFRTMGSRTRQVMGSEGIEIDKSRSVTVGKELLHKGPNMVYEGTDALTIKGPGGFIKIDAGGVTIVGKKVKINEGGSAGVADPVPTSDPAAPDHPRVADGAVDGHRGRVSNAKPLS